MFGRDEIRVLNVVQRFDNLRERRSIVGVLTPTHYDKSDHIEITVIYNKMFYDHSYLRLLGPVVQSSGVARSIIGRGRDIFIYSCSQTFKTIDFKRH